MIVLELANKKANAIHLDKDAPFTAADVEQATRKEVGGSGEIDKYLEKATEDTLVVVKKDKTQTALNENGSVDSSVSKLRSRVFSQASKNHDRNIGLVVLSAPDQEWTAAAEANEDSFKYRKVAQVDETNRSELHVPQEKKADHMRVVTTPQSQEHNKQLASIATHFAELIKTLG